MPKKICTYCHKIVEYDHMCPNKPKDTRKKEINIDSRWRKVRAKVRSRDLCCKLCLSKRVYSPGQEVHHIIPRKVCDEDKVFDADNCIYLCKDCHHTIHREGWQKYVTKLKELIEKDVVK